MVPHNSKSDLPLVPGMYIHNDNVAHIPIRLLNDRLENYYLYPKDFFQCARVIIFKLICKLKT